MRECGSVGETFQYLLVFEREAEFSIRIRVVLLRVSDTIE